MERRTSLTVYEGMTGMKENAFINTKNSSYFITADVEAPQNAASGVILAQGGTDAGWSLYVKDGKPKFVLCFDLSPAGRSSLRTCSRRARRARTRGWCSRKERPPSLLGGRACPGSALPEQRSCGSSNGSPNKLFNHTIHENQLVRS
jgi:hypothetical protein